jgi:hypothetical protein
MSFYQSQRYQKKFNPVPCFFISKHARMFVSVNTCLQMIVLVFSSLNQKNR